MSKMSLREPGQYLHGSRAGTSPAVWLLAPVTYVQRVTISLRAIIIEIRGFTPIKLSRGDLNLNIRFIPPLFKFNSFKFTLNLAQQW